MARKKILRESQLNPEMYDMAHEETQRVVEQLTAEPNPDADVWTVIGCLQMEGPLGEQKTMELRQNQSTKDIKAFEIG